MSQTFASRAGMAVVAATLALCASAVALFARGGPGPLPAFAASSAQEAAVWVAMQLGLALLGALIVRSQPGNVVGWLCCVAALAGSLYAFSWSYAIEGLIEHPGSLPAAKAMAWAASWAMVGTAPLVGTLVVLLFPNGSLPSPRWRVAQWAAVGTLLALFTASAFGDGPLAEFPTLDNPAGVLPRAVEWSGTALIILIPVSLASLVVRYRRARGEERQQLRWVAFAGLLFAFAVVLEVADSVLDTGLSDGWMVTVGAFGLLVAAGVAVLRYRLYDLDLVVNRTLLYGALTALVVAGYLGLVAGLGALLGSTGLGVSLVATAVVALLVQPLRARLQQHINQVMYGDRDDPYRALSRLGERLGEALDIEAVLPVTVEVVAAALRLPYVAIELDTADGRTVVAEHGEPQPGAPARLALEYRGEPVGRLVAAPRAATEPLSGADLRLLGDLARQAGAAAHAVRLTQELRRSRERLVSAREEERRRLRRDLHDGLGPTLAGIALEVEAAGALVEDRPAEAERLLGLALDAVRAAIGDIRRIAYDLRPPTLDELGLLAALREQAARLAIADGVLPGRELTIAVAVDGEMPPLPAAVEVAAYRIATEAMTNVTRHAQARNCAVTIAVNGALELEIVDDGRGLDPGPKPGLGLASMRERAEELGGRIAVAPGTTGGTVVTVSLPVEVER